MTAVARQKPDLSGDWRLNPQASLLSPAVASAVQSGVLHIEHRDPKFTSDLTVVFDGQPVRKTFELLSDGREVSATGDQGQRIVSSLRWHGDALVATSRIEAAGGGVTISFRYELQDAGRSLRAAEELRGGGRDQDNVWVFTRV